MDILNIIFAFVSIALGCFGWLAPKYTMSALNLDGHTDTMGMSEVRASVGCLFVGMGIGALIIGTPAAYAMLGFCWVGAAVGRLTSCLKDGATQKKWIYFIVEAVVGLPALLLNL
ncbi:MAG: DUF4345 family protein [Pseudomonadota bacterium]